jgi:microcystin synthetase protein McyC
LGPDDVILQNTSFGFDVSIWEIFTALCSGTTTRLVVSPEAAAGNPSLLVETIRRWDVTVMGLVPSVLELVLQEPNLEACSCLRHVFAGGERLDNRTREAFFRRLPTARLYNFYGPAEATVDSTYFECRSGPAERDVPIGRPIGNFRTMILDAEDQLVPPGVPGELCVGGVGLARGYLNAPRLTAERFVPDPFANGQRVYRTGDVARYRRDGQIEYLGRADNQIKLRGMRVELGEIERQLEGHPGVLRAIVSAASAAVDSRHLRITKLVDALESLSDLEAEALLATKAGAPDVVTSTSAAIEQ